ncbi:MAG: hypothetical protein E7465_04250 [Ruminococcaceae bacterium]|nr:hypothetical protein [Oscillospiraceae bacterium]
MRRSVITLLIMCILLNFAGCIPSEEPSYTFYYLRTSETIQHGSADALVAPVTMDISTPNAELDYLLQLYLDGPTKANYVNPVPSGTYLLSALWEDDILVLVLSREFSQLNNIRLTLAGCCLAATCHALTGAEAIQIRSGEAIYNFTINDCIFLDESTGK